MVRMFNGRVAHCPAEERERFAPPPRPIVPETASAETLGRLTARQKEIYLYIIECGRQNQRPPTVRGIGDRFSISSPNGVMCHLNALTRKGLIRRSSCSARGIEVLFYPPGEIEVSRSRGGRVLLSIGAGSHLLSVAEAETLRCQLDRLLGGPSPAEPEPEPEDWE